MTRMRRGGVAWAVRVLVGALVMASGVGCASPAATTAPAAGPPGTATGPAPSAPGQVLISGAVRNTGPITVAQLAAMPNRSVSVEFGSSKGTERHTEVGPPLVGVIDQAGLALATGRHNDQLSFGVLVVGADGYQALISYGEMAPGAGDRGVLLATSEDGRSLARPRLVVPGDLKGGRYVTDVVTLHVVRLTAQSRS